jgi:hypothetical protein
VTAAVTLRVLLAVAASCALLVLTALSDDIFFSDFVDWESIETISPSGEVEVIGDAHLYRIPSDLELVLKIAVPLFALIGVAAYVASRVAVRKVVAGAAASASAALFALIIQYAIEDNLDVLFVRHATTIATWSGASLAIGAASSWIAAVWWPNTSLERTRGR